jgi:hypothetical protein
MDQNTLTIIFGIIGALGVLFGIYKHFSTLKSAKVVYEIKEMADFDLPKEFFQNIPAMPITLEIINNGNKVAENLILTTETHSKIQDNRIEASEVFDLNIENNKMIIKVDKLNPAEKIKIYLTTEKLEKPNDPLVKEFNLTISEGDVNSKDNLIKQQKVIEALYESMPFGIGRIFEVLSKK